MTGTRRVDRLRRLTTSPAAAHLHQAADQLRDVAPAIPNPIQGFADPAADWLDRAAYELAWLAPFHAGADGHREWRLAVRISHGVIGLPEPDACTVCRSGAIPQEQQPFIPPAHYLDSNGVECCVHAIPVGPDSCPACRELAEG